MCSEETRCSLKKLWVESFGDSEEFVDNFFDTFCSSERVLFVEESGRVLSMLYILPFSMEGKNVGYIYAVATAQEERGKGFATFLLRKAINVAREQGYCALVTIPADEGLRLFYSRLGFAGEYHVTFDSPGDFDFGIGESGKDKLMILPLGNSGFVVKTAEVKLCWNGKAETIGGMGNKRS